jgi:hypothetical protein
MMLNDAPSALAAYRRALEIREQSLGPSHALLGMSADSLATAEYVAGNDAAAIRLFERALDIFEKNLDTKFDEFCETATRLSLVRRNDLNGNETMLRHALDVVDAKRGRRNAAYAGLASSLYSVLALRKAGDDISPKMAELGVRAGCTPKRACEESTASDPNTRARHIISPTAAADALRALEILRPRYKPCIDAARKDDPNTTGALQLTLGVGSSGAVSFVQSASIGLDERTADCLVQVALGATFEPPEDGLAVLVQPMSVEPHPRVQ